MTRLKNEIGSVFGRLVVRQRAENIGRDVAWLCDCSCGNQTIASANNLRRGHITSCGCYAREKTSERSRTHGSSHSPEYLAWLNIKRRCYNPRDSRGRYYRERGITMCDKWFDDFSAFLSDMGPRPSSEHSIDRIDNNGNYTPENCRWAVRKVQANNRRTNTLVTINGETKTIQQWADFLNVDRWHIIKILKKQRNAHQG